MSRDSNSDSPESPKDDLRLLVLEFRSLPISLADGLDLNACRTVISQFALWLLEQSRDTLHSDEDRQTHARIQNLYLRQSRGEPVDSEEWISLRAEYLAASKFWPAEWICAPCLPSAPPIARAAATIALVRFRTQPKTGEPASFPELRAFQAGILGGFLARYRR